MRLGGFVIHGNNHATLGACLDGLLSVCDRVVAVDSMSSDGSFELVRERGVEQRSLAWQGYGAARRAAVDALGSEIDYVFFLDADECLSPGATERLEGWKHSTATLPVYTVRRRNWAGVDGARYVYRVDTRARLVKREHAIWRRDMVVHEALPRLPARASGATIEHEFATTLTRRAEKDLQYALLWALQTADSRQAAKPEGLQRVAHFAKDFVFGGAALRGGAAAAKLAWDLAAYHSVKYRLLKAVRRGRFETFLELYRSDRLEELFSGVRALRGGEVLALAR